MESSDHGPDPDVPGEYVHLAFEAPDGEPVVTYRGYGLSIPDAGDEVAISDLTIHENVLEDPEVPIEPVGEYEVVDVHRHYLTILDEIEGETNARDEPIVYVTVTVEEIADATEGGTS